MNAERTLELLRGLLRTKADVVPFLGPAGAAVEAALASCLAPGDVLLVPVNGPDGRRLVQLAGAHGIEVRTITAPETRPWEVADVAAALARHPRASAIAAVHHEAAVGLVNPLAQLGALARERGLLLLADAASSAGGAELDVDGWGIDVCVTAADACLGGPAGIAPVSVGARAWERIVERRGRRPGRYLDLATWRWARAQWGAWSPDPEATAPPSGLTALGNALERLHARGLDAELARNADAAVALRRGLRALGLEPLVADEAASPAVTAVALPDGVDPVDLRAAAWHGDGVRLAPAREVFAARAVRVFHWGEAAEPSAVHRVLDALHAHLAPAGSRDVD